MKVLLLGTYFPKMSTKTMLNNLIINLYLEQNKDVYIVSDAWNDIKENEYIGEYDEIMSKGRLHKFYVDPIQLRYTVNQNIALIALCKEIIVREGIKKIICSEIIQYYLVLHYLNKEIPELKFDIIISFKEYFTLKNETYWKKINYEIDNPVFEFITLDFKNDNMLSIFDYCFGKNSNKESSITQILCYKKDWYLYSLNNQFIKQNINININLLCESQTMEKIFSEKYPNLTYKKIANITEWLEILNVGNVVFDTEIIEYKNDIQRVIIYYLYGVFPIIDYLKLKTLQMYFEIEVKKIGDFYEILNIR